MILYLDCYCIWSGPLTLPVTACIARDKQHRNAIKLDRTETEISIQSGGGDNQYATDCKTTITIYSWKITIYFVKFLCGAYLNDPS